MTLIRIQCPICEVAYQVPDSVFTTASRVRCGQCGLQYTPEDDLSAPRADQSPMPLPYRDFARPEVAVREHEPEASEGMLGESECEPAKRSDRAATVRSSALVRRELRTSGDLGPPPPYQPIETNGGRPAPSRFSPDVAWRNSDTDIRPGETAAIVSELVSGTRIEPQGAPASWSRPRSPDSDVLLAPVGTRHLRGMTGRATLAVAGGTAVVMLGLLLYDRRENVMRDVPALVPAYGAFGIRPETRTNPAIRVNQDETLPRPPSFTAGPTRDGPRKLPVPRRLLTIPGLDSRMPRENE